MLADPFPIFLNTTILVEINEITIGLFFGILFVFILIFLSALVSGSEVSFFSLNSQNLEELSEIDKKKEVQIRNLLEHPNKLLATILIANNFINVGIIVLSSYLTSKIFDFSSSLVLQFVIQVIIITFILVLLGEITPKVYAKQNAVRFSKRITSLIRFFEIIFSANSLIESTGILVI